MTEQRKKENKLFQVKRILVALLPLMALAVLLLIFCGIVSFVMMPSASTGYVFGDHFQ